MEENVIRHDRNEDDEEEYVLLDLDDLDGKVDIPPNAPYVLSGLDTMNPMLIIDDKLKLIGEYEETIGTCLVFTEDNATPVIHEETGPSETNLFSGKCIIDPNQGPAKQVKPMASFHKILKFRLFVEDDDVQNGGSKVVDVVDRDRKLGAGSYGTVFMGFTNDPNFPVIAVKSAALSASRSLQKEEIILTKLKGCDNVVRCLGSGLTPVDNNINGVHDEEFIYDMYLEFAPGGTLADLIKTKGGKLPECDVKRYTRMILQGLCQVHGRGFVHCDLKPSNILVFSENKIKIADFGLSKRAGQIDYNPQPSVFRGTPLYMSPESLAPTCEHEPPMDVWSLGCIVVEMLTGKPLWSFPDTESLFVRLSFDDELPELPENLSETGKDFLKMCFERNFYGRWTAEMLLKHNFVAEKPSYGNFIYERTTTSFKPASLGILA